MGNREVWVRVRKVDKSNMNQGYRTLLGMSLSRKWKCASKGWYLISTNFHEVKLMSQFPVWIRKLQSRKLGAHFPRYVCIWIKVLISQQKLMGIEIWGHFGIYYCELQFNVLVIICPSTIDLKVDLEFIILMVAKGMMIGFFPTLEEVSSWSTDINR